MLQRQAILTFLICLLPYSAAADAILEVRGFEHVNYHVDRSNLLRIGLAMWDTGWSWRNPRYVESRQLADGSGILFEGYFLLDIEPDVVQRIPFELRLQRTGSGRLVVSGHLLFKEATRIEGSALVFYFPQRVWSGSHISLSDANKTIEHQLLPGPSDHTISRGNALEIMAQFGTGNEITIQAGEPAGVQLWQSDSNYELRHWITTDYTPKGLYPFSLSVHLAENTSFVFDPAAPGRTYDTSGWITDALPWDQFPVDLSFLNEKPAGNHGVLKVEGDQFVFQDGERIRFWGVNFSALQCFPTKNESERTARRLAMMGVNLVRLHHLNASWSPTRLAHTDLSQRIHFDHDAWDKMDYLIYCLKEQGIYVQIDMLVDPDELWPKPQEFYTWKGFTHVVPNLKHQLKQLMYRIWNHQNSYTGLMYKDDPVFVLSTIVNENDITTHFVLSRQTRFNVEPYISEFESELNWWAFSRFRLPFTINLWTSALGKEFLNDLQAEYFEDMYDYLRHIGVDVPINGTNWVSYQKDLPSLATMDYMDNHVYAPARLDFSASGASAPARAAMAKIADKPLVISEYGIDWPDADRFTLPIQMAAVGALQDWNGLIYYAYRQNSSGAEEGPLKSAYNLAHDPMVMGVMPVCALIFRRGDVRPADKKVRLHWDEERVYGNPLWKSGSTPVLNSTVWKHQIEAALGSETDAELSVQPQDVLVLSPDSIRADNGNVFYDRVAGQVQVLTDKTSGFVGAPGSAPVILPGLELEIENDLVAVFLSSLDSESLAASTKILVTAIGRGQNTGTEWDLSETTLLEPGWMPVVAEPLSGKISLSRSRNAEMRLSAMNLDRKSWQKTIRPNNGTVEITLDRNAQTLFYILEVMPSP